MRDRLFMALWPFSQAALVHAGRPTDHAPPWATSFPFLFYFCFLFFFIFFFSVLFGKALVLGGRHVRRQDGTSVGSTRRSKNHSGNTSTTPFAKLAAVGVRGQHGNRFEKPTPCLALSIRDGRVKVPPTSLPMRIGAARHGGFSHRLTYPRPMQGETQHQDSRSTS